MSINRHNRRHQRRGQAAVIVAISATTLLGFAAFAVDVGMLYNTRAELQRCSDAAALAGAWELLDESRLKGTEASQAILLARQETARVGALNKVLNDGPEVDLNTANAADGDILLGQLDNLNNQSETMTLANDASANTVSVLVRRDGTRNGPVPLLFANIWGISSSDASARAVAAFTGNIAGYRVTEATGNAQVLPFSVYTESWDHLLDGTVTTGDNFAYDPETGNVSAGSDGILELNIFPGAGTDQLTPGNFGTVDIGNPNNSTKDLARQILYGISEADLAYIGGDLSFDENGFLYLEGDTGISAGMKDELASIIGQPRAIPVFTAVSGNGNNAVYTITKFVGIRILDVKLTGAMSKKRVVIQPAVVVDDAIITGSGTDSDFVFTPPRLVR